MKAAIVGYGYVGKAMDKFLSRNYGVVVYDPFVAGNGGSKDEVNCCDVGFVCVPTPMSDDGTCDTSIVEETIRWLTTPLIVVKSTVPPFFLCSLREETGKSIVFSPEYCGESSYWTPHLFHEAIVESPFFIFGGAEEDTRKAVEAYMQIAGPTKEYARTSFEGAAEVAKYMENTFYAMKVVFCYEMDQVCRALGVDFQETRRLWLLDPRINKMHTAVFSSNVKPYGGKCFPKDVAALIQIAEKVGYDSKFLKEIQRSNDRIGELRDGYPTPKGGGS